jgi:hypothetical protein
MCRANSPSIQFPPATHAKLAEDDRKLAVKLAGKNSDLKKKD